MILFFDTETTGQIKDWSKKTDGSDNFPRIVQIGYALYTVQGQMILQASNIIKPNGWVIDPEAEAVHGISIERCNLEGIPIEDALRAFIALHRWCDVAVAHNHNFDSKIVRSELIRLNSKYTSEMFKQKPHVCTMQSTTNFCKLPKPSGRRGYKWPKLEELHMKLFGVNPENAHDALGDVLATSKSYFKLKELGIIN